MMKALQPNEQVTVGDSDALVNEGAYSVTSAILSLTLEGAFSIPPSLEIAIIINKWYFQIEDAFACQVTYLVS
ncbi:Bystin [Echinococcus multilocularis]|uniref:Bystin n=1 Tax=Echinococcus multilocularis TaxID=6211 RepID=A0A0S4MRX0_ECHMU|nr:Bystin [Echinococcus multilocularis]